MVNFGIKLIKDALASGAYDKGVFWVGPYPFFLITDPEEVHVSTTIRVFDLTCLTNIM